MPSARPLQWHRGFFGDGLQPGLRFPLDRRPSGGAGRRSRCRGRETPARRTAGRGHAAIVRCPLRLRAGSVWFPAASAALSPLRLRSDVLVQPEQIPWIVLRLQRGQPREVAAIGPRYPVGFVLRHEVHIDATGGVWSGRRKEFARPFDRGLLVAALAPPRITFITK